MNQAAKNLKQAQDDGRLPQRKIFEKGDWALIMLPEETAIALASDYGWEKIPIEVIGFMTGLIEFGGSKFTVPMARGKISGLIAPPIRSYLGKKG